MACTKSSRLGDLNLIPKLFKTTVKRFCKDETRNYNCFHLIQLCTQNESRKHFSAYIDPSLHMGVVFRNPSYIYIVLLYSPPT